MEGIESLENLYERNAATGVLRKYGQRENQNAQPPVEDVTPNWIYELARISNSKPVLYAIPLKPPRSVEVSTVGSSHVTLEYYDGNLGNNRYTWNYVSDYEIYTLRRGSGNLYYILWHNIVDSEWYAAWTYSYGL